MNSDLNHETHAESLEQLYPLVGEALIACRLVESSFCYLMRFALVQSDVTTIDEISPISVRHAELTPMKKFLNELIESKKIDEELAARIGRFIEMRHRVIHGDYMGTELSKYNVHVRPRPDSEFLKAVIQEAKGITVELTTLQHGWLLRVTGA